MIKQLIVGKGRPEEKQLFFWNMVGSGIYALASLVLTYMTIRVVGGQEGGVFAIALTLAQMFIYIAYYEMRNFQVTDADDLYDFGDYHGIKILNCILMMAVVIGYCVVKQYDGYKFAVVCLVSFYRMLDGYADVYEAEFHFRGRLDLAGKSMAFRTIISVGIYFMILISSRNVLAAVVGAIVSGVVGIYFFDILIFDSVGKIRLNFRRETVFAILKECFPLFLGMFLWTYLLSASRMAVDDVMTSEYQSYYQILFLPVSVINLFAGFLIRPSLVVLTQLYAERNLKVFWKKIMRMVALIVTFTVICMGGAYLCGIPILNFLANCDLTEYRLLFVFLIFAGGCNALVYLLYYVLTIYRNGKIILFGYIISSVIAWLISARMVRENGLWGGAQSYLISILVLLCLFVVGILSREFQFWRKEDAE